jgi:hypothetical protein
MSAFAICWWLVVFVLAIAWFFYVPYASRRLWLPNLVFEMTILLPNLLIAIWIALTSRIDARRRFPVLSAAARGALLAVPLWLVFKVGMLPIQAQRPIESWLLEVVCFALIGATVGSGVGIIRDFIPRSRALKSR